MNSHVGFETINGKKVFNILTQSDSTAKNLVIMSHGFRGSSIGPARTFVDFESILTKNGFYTLRFDQPNSGNSEGNYVNSSFNEWVQTISYFAQKYLNLGYRVALLGQSMGASATMIAASSNELHEKIPCIMLWVPDPESDYVNQENEIGEESGQKYPETFWQEARDANFFDSLERYHAGIHLVYGEHDRYIQEELRNRVIERMQVKHQPFMVLPRQDHSPWDFDQAQRVYIEELNFLKEYFK